ncbi:MAG: tRNA lysidine(34) synthetase TilS [Saprospiraceae bacterium]|nr:tRNA lysidine(34) synthetase TilS [Saprospiraceae bacterium]
MKTQFEKYTIDNQLFVNTDKLLVAVSGGVDSIVLCQLLHDFAFAFSIAHCNFQLRGEESDGDELFVKNLAQTFDVSFFSKKFDTPQYAADHKIGIQEAARILRYDWFETLRQNTQSHYIVTAHHASDNIETFLFNFTKGAGLTGLSGMKPKSGCIVRPLLWAKKEEIVGFAKHYDLKYREDSSNDSDKYARNYIRHNIIPELKHINANFENTAIQNLTHINEARELLTFFIGNIRNDVLKTTDNQVHIDIERLKTYPSVSTVLFELIKDFGFNPTHLKHILTSKPDRVGRLFYSATHCLLIDRTHYIVAPIENRKEEIYTLAETNQSLILPNCELHITEEDERPKSFSENTYIAYFDSQKLQFPLTLRHWQKKDRFQPLGMKGKSQLLSDYFRSKKLSIFEKEAVWVLETADKQICWIVGMRQDDRFKVTASTNVFLSIVYDRRSNS